MCLSFVDRQAGRTSKQLEAVIFGSVLPPGTKRTELFCVLFCFVFCASSF